MVSRSSSSLASSGLRRCLVRSLIVLAGLVLILVAVRLAVIQGLWKPVRIASGSMAPTLLGPRFEVTCSDCRFPFAVGADYSDLDQAAICPNCGYGNALREHAQFLPAGERVLLDRLAFWSQPPQRWTMAAFRETGDPSRLTVKRIVGLPGERVAIEHGNLRINDQLLRKPLDLLRRLAIVVYDDRYRLAASNGDQGEPPLPARWKPLEAMSRWSMLADGYMCDASAPGPASGPASGNEPPHDWLAYHHWLCVENPLERASPSPVLDAYGYNQTVSRSLHFVPDLLLRAPVKGDANAGIELAIHDGRQWLRVVWTGADGMLEVSREKHLLERRSCRMDLNWSEARELEFALCDQTLWLAVDRRVLLRLPYEPAAEPPRPVTTPIRVSCPAGKLWIGSPIVLRDIHYLEPGGRGRDWTTAPLPPDHYFVLGDNVPVSDDSRRLGPVPRKSLVGTVSTRR